MQVLLKRKWERPTCTIGEWYVDGQLICNTLEPCDRGLRQDMPVAMLQDMKVYKKTAIPTGKYKITFTYSTKYGRVMPQIMNVKAFAGVRVHSGNKPDDTMGCVLLGDAPEPKEKDWVSNSRIRCKEFEAKLKEAGGTCDLEII